MTRCTVAAALEEAGYVPNRDCIERYAHRLTNASLVRASALRTSPLAFEKACSMELIGRRVRRQVLGLQLASLSAPTPANPCGPRDTELSGRARRYRYSYSPEKILPGFMMPFGSASRLIARMNGKESPCSLSRCSILPEPIPCSPVQVPPRASA